MDETILSRVALFASLSPAEIAHLAASLERTTYPPQTVLFREGEVGDRFYVVIQGLIAVIQGLDTSDERVLAVRGPGEFVGEMSLLSKDGRRTASVRTETKVQLLAMTRADFETLLQRNPSLVYEMLQVVSLRLRAAQDAAMHDLSERNRQLAQAYADLQAAQAQIIEQEALARELHLARQIQMSMLPETLPHVDGFDIGARMVPAEAVGGDFYDVFPLDHDRLAVAIGDVSGKGVPAAFFMALTCTLLRVEAHRSASPEEAVRNVNRYLLERNQQDMFVTLLYGVLYRRSREFAYVRAGHNFPLVFGKDRRPQATPPARSLPLGLFPDLLLDTRTVTLPPGWILLLYTDGVTEAMNAGDEMFGSECLEALIADTAAESAQVLCDRIVESVAAHSGETSQSDDITAVALYSMT